MSASHRQYVTTLQRNNWNRKLFHSPESPDSFNPVVRGCPCGVTRRPTPSALSLEGLPVLRGPVPVLRVLPGCTPCLSCPPPGLWTHHTWSRGSTRWRPVPVCLFIPCLCPLHPRAPDGLISTCSSVLGSGTISSRKPALAPRSLSSPYHVLSKYLFTSLSP